MLIVEDDDDIRFGVAELLRIEGYDVDTACNGREALETLQDAAEDGNGAMPSVIFLDLMMPEMDGWAFREHQLEEPDLADIPVIVLSGTANVPEKSKQLNAVGYLEKPVMVNELLNMAKKHTDSRDDDEAY